MKQQTKVINCDITQRILESGNERTRSRRSRSFDRSWCVNVRRRQQERNDRRHARCNRKVQSRFSL